MPPHTRNKETDRRSGIDRRQFSYAVHIPERRQNGERRRSRQMPSKHCRETLQIVAPDPGDGLRFID
jgi:hypothetical protein